MAGAAIALAIVANTAAKLGMVAYLGAPELTRRIWPAAALIALASTLAWLT